LGRNLQIAAIWIQLAPIYMSPVIATAIANSGARILRDWWHILRVRQL
jgi:hypothetical protein